MENVQDIEKVESNNIEPKEEKLKGVSYAKKVFGNKLQELRSESGTGFGSSI